MTEAAAQTKWGTGANAEAIQAWDGPLYDRFVRFRHIVTGGLGAHGEAALRLVVPQPGQRVLDIGCGFGDTTQEIARLVGPEGSALGVDAAERFIETARHEAAEAGIANARFAVADVEVTKFEERFDQAFSRMGTMFFSNPVAALRNVREALVPGARLAMVVWRRRIDNDWLYRAQTIVEQIVPRPEEYDEPTCGPGPFSMADADTTSEIVLRAGFADVSLTRCDLPILIGTDVEEAIDLVMSLGPAGEILRLAGDRAAHLHDEVNAALREGLAEFAGPDGLRAPASTWIVTATARTLTDRRPLRPLPLAALALACVAGLVVTYFLFVRTHAGQRIDEAALNGRLSSLHARRAAGDLLTTISVGSLAFVLALLAGQALLRRRLALAVVAIAVVLGALTTTELLKHVVLTRPELLPVPSAIPQNSFPSGHTTIAFAVGIAAALAAPPRWRRLVAGCAFLYGTAIGIATIAAGWHRPSDVAGAMLVVTGWAAAVVLAVTLADRDAFGGAGSPGAGSADERASWARGRDLEGYVLVALGALACGWAIAFAIVAGEQVGAIELTKLNAAFVAACACVAALAAILLAALLTVLREALPMSRG